jgi:hypothetical protein
VNVNVEPWPSSLVTQIRPPCSSTNFPDRGDAHVRIGHRHPAAGGPSATAETFFRWAAGDANWEGLTSDQQERVRGKGETPVALRMM